MKGCELEGLVPASSSTCWFGQPVGQIWQPSCVCVCVCACACMHACVRVCVCVCVIVCMCVCVACIFAVCSLVLV